MPTRHNNADQLKKLTMGWFGVRSFISNRRRSLAVVAGTVGTGYLITKWALNQFQQMASSSTRGQFDFAK